MRRVNPIAIQGIMPLQAAHNSFGIRIEEELVRIEAVTGFRGVWSVHAVPVQLPGAEVGKIDMPDVVGALRHENPAVFIPAVRRIEQAQFHPGSMFRKQRKVDPFPIPGCSKGIRLARPDVHGIIFLSTPIMRMTIRC
jgi:hypothetical protein